MKIRIILTLMITYLLIIPLNIHSMAENIRHIGSDLEENEISISESDDGYNCALIVVGGTNEDRWDIIFKNVADHAERVFYNKGWNVKRLFHPTMDKLSYCITDWIPENIGQEREVFIYLTNHGKTWGFPLNPRASWNEGDRLYPNQLKDMIDGIKDYYSICTVVIDTCYSGVFINDLSDENRIIITGTDNDSKAWANEDGYAGLLFSIPFFEALENNESYGRAWEIADEVVDTKNIYYENIWKEQNPWLEDSGNGVAVGDDEINTLPAIDSEGEIDGDLAKNTVPAYHKREDRSKNKENTKNLMIELQMILRNRYFVKLFKFSWMCLYD